MEKEREGVGEEIRAVKKERKGNRRRRGEELGGGNSLQLVLHLHRSDSHPSSNGSSMLSSAYLSFVLFASKLCESVFLLQLVVTPQ